MGQGEKLLHSKEGKFFVYTNNCEQKATIGTVKLMLKIPPQHNGVMPIKISGPIIEEHTSVQMTTLPTEETQT